MLPVSVKGKSSAGHFCEQIPFCPALLANLSPTLGFLYKNHKNITKQQTTKIRRSMKILGNTFWLPEIFWFHFNFLIYTLTSGDFVQGVFLTKSFDWANHKILLRKLEKIDVNGVVHYWFNSYLENRMQKISIKNGCNVNKPTAN